MSVTVRGGAPLVAPSGSVGAAHAATVARSPRTIRPIHPATTETATSGAGFVLNLTTLRQRTGVARLTRAGPPARPRIRRDQMASDRRPEYRSLFQRHPLFS